MQPTTRQTATSRDPADGLRLIPVAVVALGAPAVGDDRLMTLQAAVGRAITWIAALRLPRWPGRNASTGILARS